LNDPKVKGAPVHESHLTHTIWHRDILETAKFLFCDPKHAPFLHTQYEDKRTFDGYRTVHEMYETEWWRDTQVNSSFLFKSTLIDTLKNEIRGDTFNTKAIIAALMLYSDATSLSVVGNKSIHCMYLYLGNHEISYRRKPKNAAALLLAYIPKLNSKEEMGVHPEVWTRIRHDLFQTTMKVILEPLLQAGERYLQFSVFVHPDVSGGIRDASGCNREELNDRPCLRMPSRGT
jgi:Plavaka transposase